MDEYELVNGVWMPTFVEVDKNTGLVAPRSWVAQAHEGMRRMEAAERKRRAFLHQIEEGLEGDLVVQDGAGREVARYRKVTDPLDSRAIDAELNRIFHNTAHD